MRPFLKWPIRSLSGILVASLVLPLIVCVGISAYDRVRILRDAEESLRRTTDILHEHALRLLEIQALVIRQVERRMAGMSWDDIPHSEELHGVLRAITQELDVVDAIRVVAPQGTMVAESRRSPAPAADTGHEPFLALRDGGRDMVLARAASGAGGENAFVMARRRGPPDGSLNGPFNGLIAVSVRAETLLRLYREAAPYPNHAVGLIRDDGAFLIRDAALPPPGGMPDVASRNFRDAIAAKPEAGLYMGRSSIDQIERMVAYRKVGPYPLYIMLAGGTDAVLARWHQNVLIYGLLCGGAALSLFLMTLLALRQTNREHAALVRLEQEAARREQAETALRQSQKLEAIGKLTGGIAHDFNNLLTAVIGSLETIRTRIGTDGDIAGPVDVALQGANRAALLTQRLLAFARQQPLNPRAEDLNALVEGLTPLLRRSMTESTVLEIDLAPGLWLTSCDPVQMETALLNLAINARDAMPDGGRLLVRTGNVTLTAAEAAAIGELRAGDHVRLSVSDTGSGMPAEVLARAFDPFYTTKPVGQGTGLGLSQVYGIVRQSGGDARILSTPGRGTTVEIYLPRHAAAPALGSMAPPALTREPAREPAPERERPPAQPALELGMQPPPRILLVEDEAIVRFVAVEALRSAGYDVEEAEDAPAALTLLGADAAPFQLLVTDVGLPGLNGHQLAEIARHQRPQLRVIYMTGYAGIATDAAFEPGQLLSKPFTPEALVRKVGQALAAGTAASA